MILYAPVPAPIALPVPPQLASWDAASSPSQTRLKTYLVAAEQLVRPHIDSSPDPLGVHLSVGLPDAVPLLCERDLDNYLLPLAQHLTRSTGRTFASATASKQHRPDSRIGVGQAHASDVALNTLQFRVRTTASAETSRFKEQISSGLAEAPPLPTGPVRLDIVFTVGATRSWLNLWKPSIDALGRLLGESAGSRPWNPEDGRIIRLGLHRQQDDSLGHDVELLITATTA